MPFRRPPNFDAVYRADPDPWEVTTSWYEQRKRSVLLASLTRQRYRHAWDAACGTGVLAGELSPRCAQVLASDASKEALSLARSNCSDAHHVEFSHLPLPAARPALGPAVFDLIVLSEFLYYLNDFERVATLSLVDELATSDCEIVSVHWRHRPHDAWQSGLESNAEVIERLGEADWHCVVHHDDCDFILDVLVR